MMGLPGNDRYIVGQSDDEVIEAAGDGTDTIRSTVSYTLPIFVENLTLAGVAAINATGNGLNNRLKGNAANNVLNGRAGADRMFGRGGNDTYFVDRRADVVIEALDGGIDSVRSSVTYTLPSHVEKLVLTGAAATNGTGNDLANTMAGNAGDNVLNGMAGDDTLHGAGGDDQLIGGPGDDRLTGGAGRDVYQFDAPLDPLTNVDRINDFNAANDVVRLIGAVFPTLTTAGTLPATAFRLGIVASDATDRILYDPGTGRIRYDADGTGPVAAVRFATLATAPAVTNAVFVVVDPVETATFATGGAHTCALTDNGAAYCWGRGESGQLGAPATSSCTLDAGVFPCELVPVEVGGGLSFTHVTTGGAHTCALTADGFAYCWGNNASGQLGNNSTDQIDEPVAVATALRFDSIDAGANHTCGLSAGGSAYCWGRNNRGQLGDGSNVNRLVPVAVTGGLSFEILTAGGFDIGHTCGIVSGGVAYCWGDNERGQLGITTHDLAAHPAPVPVAGGLAFVSITAGLGRHTCALTDVGAAYCWGENTFGALGDSSMTDKSSPVVVSGGLVLDQLIAGGFIGHTCGLTAAGAAYCWGENERGQVGDGSTIDRLEPSAVTGGLEFTRLDAGFRHTCARATSGTLYCWGSGAAGQLGTNSTSQSNVPAKVSGQP